MRRQERRILFMQCNSSSSAVFLRMYHKVLILFFDWINTPTRHSSVISYVNSESDFSKYLCYISYIYPETQLYKSEHRHFVDFTLKSLLFILGQLRKKLFHSVAFDDIYQSRSRGKLSSDESRRLHQMHYLLRYICKITSWHLMFTT